MLKTLLYTGPNLGVHYEVFVESVRYLVNRDQKTYQALIEMTLMMPLKELSQRLQDTPVAAIV